MMMKLHSQVITTPKIRAALQASNEPVSYFGSALWSVLN